MFFSMRSWLRRKPRLFCRSRHTGNKLLFRPTLEELEPRIAPSAWVVTTTRDNGNNTNPIGGSLRWAIKNAAAGDSITFGLGNGPYLIHPFGVGLPAITKANVTINGYSQSGTSANTLATGDHAVLKIVLDGSGLGGAGLTLSGGSDTVEGLVIQNWGMGPGIALDTAGGDNVWGNFIGVAANGTDPAGNGSAGVAIDSIANNIIGGTTPAARNIISGNTGTSSDGVDISGTRATGNTVAGNYIGTDLTGTKAKNSAQQSLGNAANGVRIFGGASSNSIGLATAGGGNLISNNGNDGVLISDSTSIKNVVQGNYIGTDVTGTKITDPSGNALGNVNQGVELDASTSANTVGGGTTAARNIISGNLVNGVNIGDGNQNAVQGNYIGTDVNGTKSLGNKSNGVNILDGVDNTIGGLVGGNPGTAPGNLISGNTAGSGVMLSNDGLGGPTSGTAVQGNLIGTDSTGAVALGNKTGVTISNASTSTTTVGGLQGTGALNVISGNKGVGVDITGATASNQVLGNFIGTDVNGTAALGNTLSGVIIEGASNDNTIGGSVVGSQNVISANGTGQTGPDYGDGVAITRSSDNVVAGNYIGTKKDGTGAVNMGNKLDGIYIEAASVGNTIGGTVAAAINFVCSSGKIGIDIAGGTNAWVDYDTSGLDKGGITFANGKTWWVDNGTNTTWGTHVTHN
ncbi:MAG TPA: hypothetical protein VG013_07920 [Gemmataceae bacterium]|nr:hypothetical protein [Gemmataceae bacterium]